MMDKAIKQYLDNIAKEMDYVEKPLTKEELEIVTLYEKENERYIEDRYSFEEELQRQMERDGWDIPRKKF